MADLKQQQPLLSHVINSGVIADLFIRQPGLGLVCPADHTESLHVFARLFAF